jgi:hypothetical protein
MTENIEETENATEEITYCAVHTDRETSLRCNRCDRLMCAECAVQTPVGYRCKECVRQVEDKFYDASQVDYAIIFVVCAILSALGALLISFISFFLLLVIFLAIPIGGAISEAAVRAVQRRKGRYSAYAAVAGAVAGTLIFALLVAGGLPPRLLIFGGVVAFIVYGRFKMRG